MPTVLRWGSNRAFFYSNEGREPPHVHVTNGDSEAKFWLRDMSLAVNAGFARHELTAIVQFLRENRAQLLDKWNEHFED
jgi:uncharacterized protein DUF4160